MTAQGPELEGSPTNPHQTAAKGSPSEGGREEMTKPSLCPVPQNLMPTVQQEKVNISRGGEEQRPHTG